MANNGFQIIGEIQFPKYSNVNVNMLPFIIGDIKSLPGSVMSYADLIERCGVSTKRSGEVGYLSISESYVAMGESQRRGGLHTEAHAVDGWGGGTWGGASSIETGEGIYMASNISNSCAVWDSLVYDQKEMGDCEHIRDRLGKPTMLKANQLVWLTDRTPHESLPLKAKGRRQWFRLVSGPISVWYEDHSTPNPLVKPVAKVIKGNKFKV